uniref:Competence protein CoiA nuclease-like domain-containing protein n=1 Tax=viral metagenome TaxID=1070528 RepID=A0A6C0AT44_9ZZZZ
MSKLCNKSFISEYCFIDDHETHIDLFIQNKNNYENKILKCRKGHDLILVNGEKNKRHFRHKHSCDVGGNPMTEWHSEWQSYFPNTEILFPKKSTQIKDRYADVQLNGKQILEIQHSRYERDEIDNRKQDYQLHNIEIFWLVHGDNSIDVKVLEYSNRVYLEFKADHWKYESFMSYEYIYIDINSIIYKVYPKNIKSHMIDVENGKTKEEFIESLKNGIDIWKNDPPTQCNLFIRQQGAGNGKTYGIIKMLEDDDKANYINFIYITKQHSAKHIIKTEFESQRQNFQYLKNIEIIDANKKYIIKYFNEKSGKRCQVIIATIDSFTYSIGNKENNYYDKFEGLIYTIMEGYIESKKCGTIQFAGVNPKLNKETLVVIDEFQDPPEHYAKAIIQIMLNKHIDVYIVGDMLQSISNERNAFTFFMENEFPSINIIKINPSNICRRFIHPKLIEFVNYMIPFEKYGLPQVTPYKEYDGPYYEPLVFFTGKRIDTISSNEKNAEIIVDEVNKIMYQYEEEVNINNCFPEDFLIVTPFTIKNPLADALLLAINIFWEKKFTNEPEYIKKWNNAANIDDYYRYAIFHKSEEGSSIDLSESEKSTRIVSDHSSKGDGRNVVFLIGFTESAIKKFSGTNDSLVYDSLLNVAITRMKEKMYIRYENNNDDIARRINIYRNTNGENICQDNKPNITITNYIKYNDIISTAMNQSFEQFYETIIQNTELEHYKEEKKDEKKIVDMGNHIIRYSSLFVTILLEIVNKEMVNPDSEIKKQIKAILHKISESDITPTNDMKGYYILLKSDKEIPIIKISNKGKDYVMYFNIIFEVCKIVRDKIKVFLKSPSTFILCPIECIILNYMIQIIHQKEKSDININDIYNIIDIYNDSFNNNIGHEHCLCKKYFNKKCIERKNKKIDDMKLYLIKHFEKTQDVKNVMTLFHNKFPKINWLMNQTIYLEGNDSFKISKKFGLIGYDDENVVIGYIKPQFNSLNYNEILMSSIFDTYLIQNVKKIGNQDTISENYKRFYGKKVISCIFTLDKNEPYYIDWGNLIGENIHIIKNTIYLNVMEKYKLENNMVYYFYSYWRLYCPEDDKKPSKFIKFLEEKLNDHEKKIIACKFPTYLKEFLYYIQFELDNCKKAEKECLLKKYENSDFFLEKLETKLEVSLRRYLAIYESDETDDE